MWPQRCPGRRAGTEAAWLYGTTSQNITEHVRTIHAEGEQDPEATCKPLLQVQSEGSRLVSRTIKYYDLAMILAVGFRVLSPVGASTALCRTTASGPARSVR